LDVTDQCPERLHGIRNHQGAVERRQHAEHLYSCFCERCAKDVALIGGGPHPAPSQRARFLEGGPFDKLLDGVAANDQSSVFAVDVAQRRIRNSDANPLAVGVLI
jgi:hypothetical protein